MKKRIFALLTALMLLITVFAFAGCDTKKDGDDGDSSKTDVSTLSSKELFGLSVKNSLTGEKTVPDMSSYGNDMKVSLMADLNKLVIDGQDYTNGQELSLVFDVAADIENTAAELGIELHALGEKAAVEGMINQEGLYVTNLLGVNDSPLAMTFADMGVSPEDMMAQSGIDIETFKALPTLYEEIAKIITDAINANVTDSAYTAETKTVTVDGKEIKDAKVITLTITGEMAKKIISDAFTNIKAIENELIASALEGANIDELLSSLETEGFSEIRIINTVDYDKTVALDIEIDSPSLGGSSAEAAPYAEDAESDAADDTANDTATSDVETIFINIAMVGDNFKLKVSSTMEDDFSFDIAFDVKEDGAATFAVSMTEYGETITPITATGTYVNDKFDGVVNFDMNGAKASVKLTVEGNMINGKITVSDISVDQQGATVTFPIELAIDYSITGNKVRFGVAAKVEMAGTAEIDASIVYTVEYTDVTVTKPENAVSFTEIDEQEAMGWLTDIQSKYPKIFGFINDMMNQTSTPKPDYDYNENWDY